GTTRRVMAGIRLYVHASNLKISFKSPTLPQIAAAVELNLGKAEYRFQLLGLKAPNIYSQLPSAAFDVDTYSKVISSYDNIVHSLTDNTAIDPIIATVKNGQIITTP